MLRPQMSLLFGGVAALAIGVVGGWSMISGKPVHASLYAASVTTQPASVRVTAPSPATDSADQPAAKRTQTASPEPTPPAPPAQIATPDPAPVAPTAPPARTAEAPAPAPAAPTTETASADDTKGKPRIRLDGERSELSFEGDKGGISLNKDRVSLRTPFGKIEMDW